MSRGLMISIVFSGVLLGIIARMVFPMDSISVSVRAEDLIPAISFTNAMFVMLVVDVFLILIALLSTRNMQLIPGGLQNIVETIIEALYNLFRGINSDWAARAFPITGTIFLLVIFSNWAGLLPGSESIGFCHAKEDVQESAQIAIDISQPWYAMPLFAESEGGGSTYAGCEPGESIIPIWRAPSTDLNFTLALALVAWFYIQYMAITSLGRDYFTKFFPVRDGPVAVIVGIFELISVFVRIPAFMFRLFGNIFAGEVLIIVMIFLLPLVLPVPIYLFEVFVGFIQAFVFAVLTMAFLNLEVTPHHADDHH